MIEKNIYVSHYDFNNLSGLIELMLIILADKMKWKNIEQIFKFHFNFIKFY